jgi:copper chaperone NosL
MQKLLRVSRLILALASLIMITVYFVPLWEILMWAPQYPEGLQMYIWIDKLSGDVDIINGLNHYIGMKHIKVEMFPEFKIIPGLIGGVIAFGLLASLSGRKFMLWSFFAILILTGITGMVDFYLWGYDYGHNLDPTAPINIPGMSYQPPLFGTKILLNFVAYSGPATGGYIMLATGILTGLTLVLERFKNRKK